MYFCLQKMYYYSKFFFEKQYQTVGYQTVAATMNGFPVYANDSCPIPPVSGMQTPEWCLLFRNEGTILFLYHRIVTKQKVERKTVENVSLENIDVNR